MPLELTFVYRQPGLEVAVASNGRIIIAADEDGSIVLDGWPDWMLLTNAIRQELSRYAGDE